MLGIAVVIVAQAVGCGDSDGKSAATNSASGGTGIGGSTATALGGSGGSSNDAVGNTTVNSVANGWIGLSTAPDPAGPWSAERKLFTGSLYNASAVDKFIGAPEFPLARLASGTSELDGCLAFTEPSMAFTSSRAM